MKNRIMHVISAANGGVERYMQILLRNMDSAKHEHIVVCSKDFSKESFAGLAAETCMIDIQREMNPLHDIISFMHIRKAINKYKPSLVYLHSSKPGAVGRLATLGLRCRVLYNPHGWSFQLQAPRWKTAFYAAIERMLAPLADRIIVISEHEKTVALQRKICTPEKLCVILNGIDDIGINTHTVCRQSLGIPQDAYIIGTAARIARQKAPDVFAEAAAKIKKQLPNACFLWVGDGPDRSEMETKISQLGIGDSFFITGWVDNPHAYISLFDQALLLSRWEGFGLVLAEYMLLGKPIIATNVDAIPEIVKDGHTGILVPADQPDAAADAVIRMQADSALVCRLQKNGYAEGRRRFSAKRMSEETALLIKEVMG